MIAFGKSASFGHLGAALLRAGASAADRRMQISCPYGKKAKRQDKKSHLKQKWRPSLWEAAIHPLTKFGHDRASSFQVITKCGDNSAVGTKVAQHEFYVVYKHPTKFERHGINGTKVIHICGIFNAVETVVAQSNAHPPTPSPIQVLWKSDFICLSYDASKIVGTLQVHFATLHRTDQALGHRHQLSGPHTYRPVQVWSKSYPIWPSYSCFKYRGKIALLLEPCNSLCPYSRQRSDPVHSCGHIAAFAWLVPVLLFPMLSLWRVMLHVARNCKASPSCNLNYFVGHLPGNAYWHLEPAVSVTFPVRLV